MAKQKKVYECTKCGHQEPKWQGRCPDCGEWNCFEELILSQPAVGNSGNFVPVATIYDAEPARRLIDVEDANLTRIPTNISEFDLVMGGGIVVGSVNIITAEPGAGKSTLLMQVCNAIAHSGKKVLYISGEESESQVKGRSIRLGKLSSNLYIKSTTKMDIGIHYINEIKPDFVVVDSIQYMFMEEKLPSSPGNDTQIMACTNALIAMAKAKGSNLTVFMVGHLTKEGELRGSRTLEHAVDAVFKLEGERKFQLRVLRSDKNRFASTEEVGLFQMEEGGLIEIKNPSEYFLTERKGPIVGSALTVCMEGTRPIIVEIESLCSRANFGNAARVSTGYNREQLKMMLGILEIRAGMMLAEQDVYLQVTGGIRISEPAANLGILMSIASSCANKPLNNKHVFIGEVGLTGEIKKVSNIKRRLKELDKLEFEEAYVPKGSLREKIDLKHLKVKEFSDIRDLIAKVVK